jgi:hypothetical protein
MSKTNTHNTGRENMEKEITDLKEKMVEYDNIYNEGNNDGYNPYRDKIIVIQDRIFDAKDVTWTKEVTINRRKEWKEWVLANNENGKVDGKLVSTKINEQGWNIQQLKEAVEKHNL